MYGNGRGAGIAREAPQLDASDARAIKRTPSSDWRVIGPISRLLALDKLHESDTPSRTSSTAGVAIVRYTSPFSNDDLLQRTSQLSCFEFLDAGPSPNVIYEAQRVVIEIEVSAFCSAADAKPSARSVRL